MNDIIIDYSLGDDMSDSERILLQLTLGQRKPQNQKEEDLLKEIKEIEAKGHSLDIPTN